MKNNYINTYLNELQQIINRGDAREESYYATLSNMLQAYADENTRLKVEITTLPKKTDAGNPDFRIWHGRTHITGYVEAKAPTTFQLDPIAVSEQLKRYLATFPNLILTNFYEFRLYQQGTFICSATIAHASNALNLNKTPPLLHPEELDNLLQRYFSYTKPEIKNPKVLAIELAKRTRFLRDEVIQIELEEENQTGKRVLLGFYDSFKKLLINSLTEKQFADLYAQTLTYGIFAARTKSSGEFNRELIYKYIPNTLGILKSIFHFISYEDPPQALAILIDDIADILCAADIKSILHKYYIDGRGKDPIVHFYETFLAEFDPALREKRGVYYTPEPVVRYIVNSIHYLLKDRFNLADGLASQEVTLLDPAAGTLTFPAEAIRTSVDEYTGKYGEGGLSNLIKNHILPHFNALELMVAPYTVGHLKMSYLFDEFGYNMAADERFKLYLTNTLDPDTPPQMETAFTHDITEESTLANKVKHQEPILVIMGNPPYSMESENTNAWTEKLLKTDIDGAQSYYSVDGLPLSLDEKNLKPLQDDYIKFIRFAQWKIHKAGKGVVGMITNHTYLDSTIFRGMRQSLMETFDELYLLDLHGNTLKKEKCSDGSKDENVFDIKQGVAIVLMVKYPAPQVKKIYKADLQGLREFKYKWLDNNTIASVKYEELIPSKPFYLFIPQEKGNEHYLEWPSLQGIFPVNSVGIVSARDNLTIQFNREKVLSTINLFSRMEPETARLSYKLGEDTRDWKLPLAQDDLLSSGISEDKIVPIVYRPFDVRYTYYTGKTRGFHCMPRYNVMKHMLIDNICIICNRQTKIKFSHALIADSIVDYHILETANANSYCLPLFLYPSAFKDDIFTRSEREYNISHVILDQLSNQWPQFIPEQLFYYVYAVLFSNSYRTRYAQYLKMDFPRIPFPEDYETFRQMADFGVKLADLHLLKSPLLDKPMVKYQGSGTSDLVGSVAYDETVQTVRINPHKYFEGVTPEMWNYHIGGYQVLQKYLKDRKGRQMEDPVRYCRIATAIKLTMDIQDQIDIFVSQSAILE